MSASVIVPQSGLDGVVKPQEPMQPEIPMDIQDQYNIIKGELTPEREEALFDSYKYLQDLGFADYLSGEIGDSVYLDSGLKENVLGVTQCGMPVGDIHCKVSLRPEIYDGSFENMDDGSLEHLVAKYHQVHTLAHELYHKDFLESQEGGDVVHALEELEYSESEIAGVVEMITEQRLANMYLEKDAMDLAKMVHDNTPYGKQLGRGKYIEDKFDGGMDGFLQYLAGGDVDKNIVTTYLDDIGIGPINK